MNNVPEICARPKTICRIGRTLTIILLSILIVPFFQRAEAQAALLTLTLECRDADHITFTIRNVSTDDTALKLGAVLGNGRKYMLEGLTLSVPGAGSAYEYNPYDYPGVVGGALGEWIQPFPARGAYAMSAEASDFIGRPGRLKAFPREGELSVRLVVGPPTRPGTNLLTFWTGTLVSNRLQVSECGRPH